MRQTVAIFTGAFLLALHFSVYAELPPPLPGEEITRDYLNAVLPKDTAKKANEPNPQTAGSTGLLWLDKAQKTWEAPTLAEQLAAEEPRVPIGKGGIFVPRLSPAAGEPEVYIADARGRDVASGKAGSIFSVEPGAYTVRLGSGAHNQRIVRSVTVEEGKTVTVIPDWSGLAIETVDTIAVPFRGEYELVRIDEFEAYGRGFGANQELGEQVKTWIVNPGIYKILGVGQGYNSLLNFITVRLVPGELTRVLIVQDTIDYKIFGGGTVDVTPRTKITSHWKYGADIGGNVKFNQETDRQLSKDQQTTTNTLFGMLSNLWFTYEHAPYDWQTRARLDEGFNFTGFDVNNLLTDADDFLLTSLVIWRFLPWFGPYGRAELRTNFLPRRQLLDKQYIFFCTLDKNNAIPDPSHSFDSTSSSFRIRPSFAPLSLQLGVGANADVINYSFLETKLRAGFGSSYTHYPNRFRTVNINDVNSLNSLDTATQLKLKQSIIVSPEDEISIFELGPQVSVSGMVRIGRFATADAELKVFAPIAPEKRLTRPDFDLRTNLSWRLVHGITLDYTYTFLLTQPENEKTRQNISTQGIWLRFSYSSR